VLPDKTHAVFHGLKSGVAKSRFKFQAIAICAALMTFATTGWGQATAGYLDFGTSTSGTAATTSNTGFGGVRTGTTGGGWTIQNVGQTIGTAGELRGIAPTTASVNSVGITSTEFGTSSATFTIAFELYLSGGASGTWSFFAGNGASFAAAQTASFTGAEVFTGIQWIFGASNGITANNRAVSTWSAISGTPFAQNTAYQVVIVGNNSSSTVNYGASNAYSIAAYKYDLWVNGTLVGDDLGKAQLSNGTAINAFRFYGESSTGNVATIALDNVRWYTSCVLPPTHLIFSSVPSTGTAGSSINQYTVGVRSGSTSGPVANSFIGPVTVSKASGSGSISGTLSPNAVAGTATFSDTVFSAADTYTLTAAAAAPIVATSASGNIVISGATPTIVASGTLSAVNTTYGTASASPTSFTVSGANMSAGITVTPPSGFEVSQTVGGASGYAGSGTAITVGSSGTIASTTVYVRLAANAPVGAYSGNIVLSSTSASNVNVATVSSTVTAKGLTITGASAANRAYNGSTTVAVSGGSLLGVVSADSANVTLSAASATGAVATAAVGDGKSVTVTGYSISGAASANYSLTQPTGVTVNITKANQTITFGALATKNFGDANFNLSAAASSGLTVSYSSSNTGVATVSGNTVTLGSSGTTTITASQAGDSNYNAATSVPQTLTVNAVAPGAPTLGAITAGDGQLSVAFTAPVSSGGASITDYQVSFNGGSYTSVGQTMSPLIISGLSNGTEYTVLIKAVNSAGAGAASGSGTGTPVAASVPTIVASTTVNGALSTTYGTDSSTATFTVSGSALNGDLTVTPPAGFQVSTSSNSNFGSTATLTQSSGTVASTTVYVRLAATTAVATYSGNIVVSGGGATSQNVATISSTVSAKSLTITSIGIANKVYDRTTTATITGTATYGGLQNGESFSVTGTPSASFATATVGLAKPVTVTGYSAPNSNYTLTQPTLAADISAVALTVTGATVTPKSYDGNTAATITGTLSGVLGSDTVNLNGTGTFGSANVGTGIAVTSTSTLSGEHAINYSLTQPTGLSANISAVGLTITGISISDKVYNGNNTATISGMAAYIGLVNGETFSVSGTPSATFADKEVGTGKSVTVSGYTAPSGNYSLTQPTGLSANITAKGLTITGISIANKVYDRSTTATITGTPTYVGLENGETFSATGGSASFGTVSVGNSKPVNVTGYTAPSPNYTVTQPTGLTGNITAAALSVTGSTVTTKLYDGNTTATITGATLNGVIASDAVNLTGGTSGTFANANVGTGIAVSTAMGITGADAGNYSFTAPTGLTGEIAKATPLITFGALPSGKKVGQAAFTAGATTTVGTLSYSSSNVNVATVDGSGNITPVAPGVTTITATVAGTANYNAAAPASQTLNVAASGGASGSFTVSLASISNGTSTTTKTFTPTFAPTTPAYATQSGTFVQVGGLAHGASDNAAYANWAGFDDTTRYFYYAITAVNGQNLTITAINSSIRSSNTGPRAVAIETSDSLTGTWTQRTISNLTSANDTAANITGLSISVPAGTTLYVRYRNTSSISSNGTTVGSTGTFRLNSGSLVGTYNAPITPAITPSGTLAAVSTTYGTASAASATTVTVTGGSLTADILATAPTGFEVSNDGATYGATATFAQSGGFANGTLYLRLAANAAAGAYDNQVVRLTSTGASNQTVAIASSTVSAGSLAGGDIALTPVGDGSYTASGPVGSTFSYSYAGRSANGINTSYSSATAPTSAGFYTVTATATGNYSGSNTADYFVAGPVAVSDAITKPAGNPSLVLTLASLLANDVRITPAGAVATDGLSITGVTNGSGNSAEIDGGDILFSPGGASPETFTYTVSDGTKSATATVTVTTESSAPTFSLQIVKVGTATFSAPNTSVTHDFIGVPNQTYAVEYSTDLTNWTSAGNRSTGATGSFSLNITKSGDVAADWNAHMFFRARLVR